MPGLQAGEESGATCTGTGKTVAIRTLWLPEFFDHTCDPVKVRTAYRCRAYPDEAQQAVLNRTFGCVRVVWNRTLAARQARWHQAGEGTSYVETDRALRHQHRAFQAFFARRARYPRFKSRRSRQSAHYTRRAFTLRGGQLRLAKTSAPLRFVWSWPEADLTTLDPAMVIISRESDGRWYATFTIDASDPEPLPETGRAVGVDLGVTHFAVTSAGEKIDNPRHLERRARSLARYQRRLARCQQGSANRVKAAAKVARAHRKVRHARADFLHRASTRLVRENDVIVIEDLNVAGMVRNRRLARAISGCGWGEFRRQLACKCERYGRRLVVIDRWYPQLEDLLGVRVPAGGAEPVRPALDVLVLRRPARPGPQRRDEHPCGRSCRSPGLPGRCLRSWRKTFRVLPGALSGETGTPAREGRNPRPSGRGVVKFSDDPGKPDSSRRSPAQARLRPAIIGCIRPSWPGSARLASHWNYRRHPVRAPVARGISYEYSVQPRPGQSRIGAVRHRRVRRRSLRRPGTERGREVAAVGGRHQRARSRPSGRGRLCHAGPDPARPVRPGVRRRRRLPVRPALGELGIIRGVRRRRQHLQRLCAHLRSGPRSQLPGAGRAVGRPAAARPRRRALFHPDDHHLQRRPRLPRRRQAVPPSSDRDRTAVAVRRRLMHR